MYFAWVKIFIYKHSMLKIIITENQLKNIIKNNIIIESKQVGILYHAGKHVRAVLVSKA